MLDESIIMTDYCTSTDIFAEIPESKYGIPSSDGGSTDWNTAVAGWCTTASRLIDGEFGVPANTFLPTTDEKTLYYDGSGEEEQNIGLWVSVSEVAMSEVGELVSTGYTVFDADDYLTWPYNSTPIKKLILDNLNETNQWGAFYTYRKAVRVKGIPGYSLTPPAVVAQACKMQVVLWLQSAKQMYQGRGANGAMTTLVVDTSQLDPRISGMLKPIKLELSA